MKFISLVILTLMMSYASSHAQDTTRAKLERAGYVVGSSLAFSLGDYVAFNLIKQSHGGNLAEAPVAFRLIEGVMQAAITYLLYKQ
ncbi:MAG: hypothetical protein ACHQNE_07675, partial [Candidatus Kapaibacterium sp.]